MDSHYLEHYLERWSALDTCTSHCQSYPRRERTIGIGSVLDTVSLHRSLQHEQDRQGHPWCSRLGTRSFILAQACCHVCSQDARAAAAVTSTSMDVAVEEAQAAAHTPEDPRLQSTTATRCKVTSRALATRQRTSHAAVNGSKDSERSDEQERVRLECVVATTKRRDRTPVCATRDVHTHVLARDTLTQTARQDGDCIRIRTCITS